LLDIIALLSDPDRLLLDRHGLENKKALTQDK
jgi:hypothetical protein